MSTVYATLTVLGTLLLVWLILSLLYGLCYWFKGFMGWDQPADPHGRYYNEWLKSDSDLDYGVWLYKRK